MNDLLKTLRRLPHRTILAIIALQTLVYLVQATFGLDWPQEYGAKPSEVLHAWHELRAGQGGLEALGVLATLVTALFLHGGPEHLVGNMVFLWTFGSLTAELLGKWWAVALFLATGVAGNLLQIALEPNSPWPIIGASGAVCGFEGVYFGLALRWHLDWPDVWPLARPIPPMQLAAFAGIGIAFDLYGIHQRQGGIAFGAHVGGFFAGLLLAGLITQLWRTPEAWGKRRKAEGGRRNG